MTADTTPERQGYTPPMSKLRDDYLEEIAYRGFADLYAAEWDRALAAHDAEVARKMLTEAADELSAYYPEDVFKPMSNADHASVNNALAGRATGTPVTRDRVSGDAMRRAFGLLRVLAEQIGEK